MGKGLALTEQGTPPGHAHPIALALALTLTLTLTLTLAQTLTLALALALAEQGTHLQATRTEATLHVGRISHGAEGVRGQAPNHRVAPGERLVAAREYLPTRSSPAKVLLRLRGRRALVVIPRRC